MKEYNTQITGRHKKNRIITGLFIAGYGILLFASKAGAAIPAWVFSWPMFLIALGFYNGLKHDFRNISWAVLMITGGLFLADKILKIMVLHTFMIPILLIAAGIYLISNPAKHNTFSCRREYSEGKEFHL